VSSLPPDEQQERPPALAESPKRNEHKVLLVIVSLVPAIALGVLCAYQPWLTAPTMVVLAAYGILIRMIVKR
jgi:uncharacterized membrane protein (DUF485 family)